MNIAAIIVGIENWQKYTLPLVRSIREHESDCAVVVIDNGSAEPYPWKNMSHWVQCQRTERLCYSAAINTGKRFLDKHFNPDWYIVLSNDVLCTGPFAHILEAYGDGDVVGPLLKEVHGFPYLEGWAMFFPRRAWDAIGGFDEDFLGSDWEDVDASTTAREKGFGLVEDRNLPFVHLDQRQRYYIVEDFAGKNAHNQALFMRKHARVTA